MEVLRAHPRGKPLDAPAVTVANLVGKVIPTIEAEARAATLEAVLRGLRSEDDSVQLRAIIAEIEAMMASDMAHIGPRPTSEPPTEDPDRA